MINEFFLVTGGAGFIGSHLVEKLVKLGCKVRIIDDFSTGKKENIEHLRDKIELIEGDIRDLDLVKEAVEGVDYVFHLAAISSVNESIENPERVNSVNVEGTLNVLNCSRSAKVKRVIFASSAAVYGENSEVPHHEETKLEPCSPYGVTKFTGELYCKNFYKVYGIETVILRYFNVFGPRQDPESEYAAVVPKFINALLNKQPITIFGDGQQSRDFVYVEDVVRANLLTIKAGPVGGEVFNIACGESFTINNLAKMLIEIIGPGNRAEPLYAASRPGDIRYSFADISKARSILDFHPRVSIYEGLKLTVEWYKNHFDLQKYG